MSDKAIDTVTAIAGSLAGLANDMHGAMRKKVDRARASMNAADEVQILKRQISELEARVASLEEHRGRK